MPARKCPICGKIVALTASNMLEVGYSCPEEHYYWITRRGIPYEKLLKATRGQVRRAKNVGEELMLLKVKTWRDNASLKALYMLAKMEEPGFRNICYPEEEFQRILFIKGQEIVGYLAYNRYKECICLRQIYVRPEFRRRGIALRATLAVAGKEPEVYVESPNEKTLRLLEKLGWVRREGDRWKGDIVRFLQGF